MATAANPFQAFTFKWWMHEASVSEEDGHPDAARVAYASAAGVAENDYDRSLAVTLFDGIPSKDRA